MKSKLLNLAVVLLVIVYVCFNFKGQIRLEYACPNYHTATEVTKEVVKEVIKEVNYTALMEKLNEEKCAQDDPRLIKLIRERYLEPPSTLPYNLTNPNRPDYSEFGQTRVVEMHLNNMVKIYIWAESSIGRRYGRPILLLATPYTTAEPCENVPSSLCGQLMPWSDCASAQSDLGLSCLLTESLDTVNVSMESKGSKETLSMRIMILICICCACSKPLFAWRGPSIMILLLI